MISEDEIKFRISSPIGLVEINAKGEFITSIKFIDDETVPNCIAEIKNLPVLMQHCMEELNAYFNGDLQQFSFPHQQEGTDFRQRVWSQINALPYGQTVSYLEISKRLGDLKSIRAAASANGRNQLAIVVPCHRVIGNDGNLRGYAGGLWRKQWLLQHENKYSGNTQQLSIF